jgi:hypothetical protein
MKILKQGEPIKLYGECGGCHTIIESDTKDATPSNQTGWSYTRMCPTCRQVEISLFLKLKGSDGATYPSENIPPDFLLLKSCSFIQTETYGGKKRAMAVRIPGVTFDVYIDSADTSLLRDFLNRLDTSVS